jgi:hypothetical protein
MSFQLLAFFQNPLTLIKRFRFNQSLRESTKKPINTLGNQKRKEKRKNLGKYSINGPYSKGSKA